MMDQNLNADEKGESSTPRVNSILAETVNEFQQKMLTASGTEGHTSNAVTSDSWVKLWAALNDAALRGESQSKGGAAGASHTRH
jgi:hypothetical protein